MSTQTPDWDDLRLFLMAARDGSLIAAARRLQVNQTTVARRLSNLEAQLGARLFDRSPRGIVLTDAGAQLQAHVERIETEVTAAAAHLGERDASGVVRLSTPEAFGAFLVAPNARRLHDRYPELQLELIPESRAVSLSKREADLAVTLHQPPRGRVAARKLGDYRLGLFASRDYLAAHPAIEEVGSVRDHPLVWYIDEMIDMPELRYLDQVIAGAATAFRSSSIVAQQAAVANGFGLGLLHVFAAEQDPRLVRILPAAVEVRRSYWLVIHEDLQRVPRIRAVADFLGEIVAENRRWF